MAPLSRGAFVFYELAILYIYCSDNDYMKTENGFLGVLFFSHRLLRF